MFYVEQGLDQIKMLKDHLSNSMENELEEARLESKTSQELTAVVQRREDDEALNWGHSSGDGEKGTMDLTQSQVLEFLRQ